MGGACRLVMNGGAQMKPQATNVSVNESRLFIEKPWYKIGVPFWYGVGESTEHDIQWKVRLVYLLCVNYDREARWEIAQ